jgi:hypothetical protein
MKLAHPAPGAPKMRPTACSAALALTLVALSGAAFAQEDAGTKNFEIYFGAGGGASPMHLDSRDFNSEVGGFFTTIPGRVQEVTQDNSVSGGYKGFIGVRLFRYIGLEAGFGSLGSVSFTAEGTNWDRVSGNDFINKGEYAASMAYRAALLTLPTDDLGSYFHLKAGTADVDVTLKETISTRSSIADTVRTTTRSSTHPLFGIGYTMAVGEKNGRLRLEVEHLGEIGDVYRFGESPGRASVTFISTSYIVSF